MKSEHSSKGQALRVLLGRQLRAIRERKHESQSVFWSRFGVSQPTGSRIEQGAQVPEIVDLFLHLYVTERIGDSDLLPPGEAWLEQRNQPQLQGAEDGALA